jgi:hypothetical protein
MPWEGVTVREQQQEFPENYKLNCYPISELDRSRLVGGKLERDSPAE